MRCLTFWNQFIAALKNNDDIAKVRRAAQTAAGILDAQPLILKQALQRLKSKLWLARIEGLKHSISHYRLRWATLPCCYLPQLIMSYVGIPEQRAQRWRYHQHRYYYWAGRLVWWHSRMFLWWQAIHLSASLSRNSLMSACGKAFALWNLAQPWAILAMLFRRMLRRLASRSYVTTVVMASVALCTKTLKFCIMCVKPGTGLTLTKGMVFTSGLWLIRASTTPHY